MEILTVTYRNENNIWRELLRSLVTDINWQYRTLRLCIQIEITYGYFYCGV